MTHTALLHHLLYRALQTIRADGSSLGNQLLFRLADLLWAVPLELERAAQGGETYEDVLARLRDEAQKKGTGSWIEHASRNFRAHEDLRLRLGQVPEGAARNRASEARQQIYYFLHLALVEMRVEARDIRNARLLCLTDVLHNVPLQLAGALIRGTSYDSIVAQVLERARRGSCKSWIEQALDEVGGPTAEDEQS